MHTCLFSIKASNHHQYLKCKIICLAMGLFTIRMHLVSTRSMHVSFPKRKLNYNNRLISNRNDYINIQTRIQNKCCNKCSCYFNLKDMAKLK